MNRMGARVARITLEQISAEIADLKAEVDQKISSVAQVFQQCARIREQIEHLEKLQELRRVSNSIVALLSYVFLGVTSHENLPPATIAAVTWEGSPETPSAVTLTLREDYERLLSPEISDYFADLIADWQGLLSNEPDTFLRIIGELSVGPIQALDQGVAHRERVQHLLLVRLGRSIGQASGASE